MKALTDLETLEAMDLKECGWTFEAIGQHLGRSRNSIAGALRRVKAETDATDCGNHNGTLPARWWDMGRVYV